jgi:hypothetical protein
VFLVQRLPAWGTTLGSRVTRHSKIHLVDAGVMASLLALSPEKIAQGDPAVLSEMAHCFRDRRAGVPRLQRLFSAFAAAGFRVCGLQLSVRGPAPSRFALAWRAEDRRPLVLAYARACRPAGHVPGGVRRVLAGLLGAAYFVMRSRRRKP